MKFTYAIAAFLGVAAANEPVWSLRSVNDHKTDSSIQAAYGDHSIKQANARPPYQSAIQQWREAEQQDYTDEVTRKIFNNKSFDNSKDIFGTKKPAVPAPTPKAKPAAAKPPLALY